MKNQDLPRSSSAQSERAPQSLLQNRILLLLARGEVDAVGEIAQRLEGNRSSVSRAVSALEKQGLLGSEKRRRFLTEAGLTEVERLRAVLPERAQQAASAALAAVDRQSRVYQSLSPTSAEQARREYQSLMQQLARSAVALPTEQTRRDHQSLLRQIKGISMTYPDFKRMAGVPSAADIAAMTRAFQVFRGGHIAAAAQAAAAATAAYSGLQPWRGEAARVSEMFSGYQAGQTARIVDMIASVHAPHGVLGSFPGPSAVAEIVKSMEKSQAVAATAAARSVMASLDSQRLSMDVLLGFNARAMPMAGVTSRSWSEANMALSRIVGDLSSIREQILRSAAPSHQADALAPLLRGVRRVTWRYDRYLREALDHLEDVQESARSVDVVLGRVWDVEVPAEATSRYVASVRETIVPDEEAGERRPVAQVVIERREAWRGLDEALGKVAPRFVPMWHGAWETLGSDGSDRVRQAAHSGREVLAQVLHAFAPDEAFTSEELKTGHNGRPTRKMRFRKAVGDASQRMPDLLEAMARVVDETYARLSAVSHDHSDRLGGSEQEVVGMLEMLQGLLRCLLALTSNRKT